MKNKLITGLLITGLVLGNASTTLAAPVSMPDGTIFDAVYYAQTYPDVAAVYGTDADALYSHYITYGRAEGRLPVGPDFNESAQKSSSPQDAVVLNNTAANGANPYAGKPVSLPAGSLATDGLTYPVSFAIALGNGTVVQYDGSSKVSGGYVTAILADHTLMVSYDLLTSANGKDFNRFPSESEYLFFIRNASTGQIAGIFKNNAGNGGFSFPGNDGSRTFDINESSQIWIPSTASTPVPNNILPDGSYFVAVGTATSNTLTASNIFTINRTE